uniref:Uncharacterized protein n=1 Tax=Arion vulgaris TaxID=1028688 RepID=A0A0B7AKT7_9EUPU
MSRCNEDTRRLRCSSVNILHKDIIADTKKYHQFLMTHLHPEDGVSHCRHADHFSESVSELIKLLENMKHYVDNHVTDVTDVTLREYRGRQNTRDSGVGSAPMSDLKFSTEESNTHN